MTNKKMLLCSDEASVHGCDISYYQGNIDFKVMKAAGIKVVIIRAGYGTTIDKRFISYINAAIKTGLAVGIIGFYMLQIWQVLKEMLKSVLKLLHHISSILLVVYGAIGNMILIDMQEY